MKAADAAAVMARYALREARGLSPPSYLLSPTPLPTPHATSPSHSAPLTSAVAPSTA